MIALLYVVHYFTSLMVNHGLLSKMFERTLVI